MSSQIKKYMAEVQKGAEHRSFGTFGAEMHPALLACGRIHQQEAL